MANGHPLWKVYTAELGLKFVKSMQVHQVKVVSHECPSTSGPHGLDQTHARPHQIRFTFID